MRGQIDDNLLKLARIDMFCLKCLNLTLDVNIVINNLKLERMHAVLIGSLGIYLRKIMNKNLCNLSSQNNRVLL